MYRVLICNDDGIAAQGIRALAEAFRDAGYHVTVCAPDRERSCISHALTLIEPMYVSEQSGWLDGVRAYAVNGTPADCCRLGLDCLTDQPVDLVLSGINQGDNTGSDTLYSGTVAAAMEGALSGVPAMAVSLNSTKSRDFSAAQKYALQVADQILSGHLPRCMVYNLNVPAIPENEIRGLRAAPLALKRYEGGYVKRVSPLGREYYWANTHLALDGIDENTDIALVLQGWAVLTPLDWSMNHEKALSQIMA